MSLIVAANPSLQDKFNRMEDIMKGRIFERPWEIRTAIIAMIARKHHCSIGEKGIAKTMLADELVSLIDGLGDHYFRYLMTPYTTPPEVFGPVSLQGLKNDVQKFNTAGKLPTAHVAFLDEFFKANSAILNSLLTIMNEGMFFNNGDDPHVPLGTIFTASNELPRANSELAALFDRVTIRHETQPLRETSNFMQVIRNKAAGVPLVAPVITWDEVLQAQKEAAAVQISEIVVEKLAELRIALRKNGINPSVRRFTDCVPIIKATAWREGRTIADQDDMRLLQFVLWEDVKDQALVKKLVLEICNPLDKEAQELIDLIEEYAAEVEKVTADAGDDKTKAQQLGMEVYGKLQRCDERLDELLEEAKKSPRRGGMVEEAKARVAAVLGGLLYDLFGVTP